jgi:type VI secretion system Hcp family effector
VDHYVFYMRATGAQQGAFPSESERAKKRGAECYRFRFGSSASNDPTRSADFAARFHEPIVVVKAWGEASAHYLHAYYNNETLSEVTLEFVRSGVGGEEEPLETLTMKNATIASLRRHVGEIQDLPHAELEEIAFRFEEIEIKARGANKSIKFDFKNRK